MNLRRRMLTPLVPLYAAGLRAKRRMAETGRVRPQTLERPVLSIGSLSAGGAGKTPFVLAMTEALMGREYPVSILSRGYRRRGRGVERVDPGGEADRYGDEPLLLARRAGVPVYVGANRYQAGLLAEAEAGQDQFVHLLDDGFQHRQLARDLDLLLLTRKDVEDTLLPAGNLREPLTALRDADVIVLREDEASGLQQFVSAMTREKRSPAIWVIRRSLRLTPKPGQTLPRRPLVFCGIARPESFSSMLLARSITPAAMVALPDHYRYTGRDVERLVEEARRNGADGFVTTEKDAVKLVPELRAGLERVGPVAVPQLQVSFVNERAALEQLIALAPRMDRRRGR